MDEAKKQFQMAFEAAPPEAALPLWERSSSECLRVNFGSWKGRGLPPEWLFRLFFGARPVDAGWDGSPRGCPVSTRFLPALRVLEAAVQLPPNAVHVIAMDGRAAAGKTTLTRQLAVILEAGVVQMDDFFLPAEFRTPERYATPGGNVHYERFVSEVLPRLRDGGPFAYRAFDCSRMAIGEEVEVKAAPWRIVEGAYSLHPDFGEYAELGIFCDISPEEQERRIRVRNGEERWKMFQTRWIPLEELYIRECKVIQRAKVVLEAK